MNLNLLSVHARIEEITIRDEQKAMVKLRLNHREDIQGECFIPAWEVDVKGYYLGQEFCGIFSPQPFPHYMLGLRLNASIHKISRPFNHSTQIEIVIEHEPQEPCNGECRFRIDSHDAFYYRVGHKLFCLFSPAGNTE